MLHECHHANNVIPNFSYLHQTEGNPNRIEQNINDALFSSELIGSFTEVTLHNGKIVNANMMIVELRNNSFESNLRGESGAIALF